MKHEKQPMREAHEGRNVKHRKPEWAGAMEYGVPQKCELKQWPRYEESNSADYARAGYNNSQKAAFQKKSGAEELDMKGMYV